LGIFGTTKKPNEPDKDSDGSNWGADDARG